jgi:hypothetical protein
MESESLLPLERVAWDDGLEPRTSFLDLIVVLTSKMFCRMKLKKLFAPRQEQQIKLKMGSDCQRNSDKPCSGGYLAYRRTGLQYWRINFYPPKTLKIAQVTLDIEAFSERQDNTAQPASQRCPKLEPSAWRLSP